MDETEGDALVLAVGLPASQWRTVRGPVERFSAAAFAASFMALRTAAAATLENLR